MRSFESIKINPLRFFDLLVYHSFELLFFLRETNLILAETLIDFNGLFTLYHSL